MRRNVFGTQHVYMEVGEPRVGEVTCFVGVIRLSI